MELETTSGHTAVWQNESVGAAGMAYVWTNGTMTLANHNYNQNYFPKPIAHNQWFNNVAMDSFFVTLISQTWWLQDLSVFRHLI